MPPIPIHSNSPINPVAAVKANGTTRQTLPVAAAQYTPNQASGSSATINDSPAAYHAARPVAPAFPAPTGAPTLTGLLYQQQPSPTRTTALPQYDGPPLPQPGGVPDPFAGRRTSATPLPPPPKAGEAKNQLNSPITPSPTSSITQAPPQFYMPAPSTNLAPTHSTTTASPKGIGANLYTTTLHVQPDDDDTLRRPSLEHPPGYMQNLRAVEMTAAQRAAQLQQEQESGGFGAAIAGFTGGSTEPGILGGLVGSGENEGTGTGGQIMWDSAKKWIGSAAEKVGELEGEVWKRVNGH